MVVFPYMNGLATITSKRQLTIPAEIYRRMSLSEGKKVTITIEDTALRIEPVEAMIHRLAGSITVPRTYKNMTPDKMISAAKRDYFAKKFTKSHP